MVDIEYCTRCGPKGTGEASVLHEIACSPSRSIEDINQQIYKYIWIEKKVKEQLEKRLKEQQEELKSYKQKLRDYEEWLSSQAVEQLLQGEEIDQIAERIMTDKLRQELEQAINTLRYQPDDIDCTDVEAALEEYQIQGYINIEEKKVRITSRGAKLLAKQALRRVLENLAKKDMGVHRVREIGYGSEASIHSRQYKLGDEYEFIDIEKTLLNALERSKIEGSRPSQKNWLKNNDFRVFETQHQSRMCAGLIIDGSGSMQYDNKIEAAIEASLALSELIRREPKDLLKVFTFSERAKNIPSWDIVNAVAGKGSTDIRAGMRAFRISARYEKGDKQAYLITDAEPNSEDGIYIGFEKAVSGVLQEALHYREDGITLNIIMLDQKPSLKDFASILAQRNLGRVLFATPYNLGTVIVEDYLKAKVKKSV